jgi:[histone H3]-lysine4/36 N-trimethyltransferase SMYD
VQFFNLYFTDYSDLKADKKRMDHFSTLCVVLHEFLKDISLPNTVELMGIYGRVSYIHITVNRI